MLEETKDTTFKVGDKRINRGGRPRGRKNKISPKEEISRALSSGKSLTEIVEFLSNALDNKSITFAQKTKFLDTLVKIKMELLVKEIKIEDLEKSKSNTKEYTKDLKSKIKNSSSTIAKFERSAS